MWWSLVTWMAWLLTNSSAFKGSIAIVWWNESIQIWVVRFWNLRRPISAMWVCRVSRFFSDLLLNFNLCIRLTVSCKGLIKPRTSCWLLFLRQYRCSRLVIIYRAISITGIKIFRLSLNLWRSPLTYGRLIEIPVLIVLVHCCLIFTLIHLLYYSI